MLSESSLRPPQTLGLCAIGPIATLPFHSTPIDKIGSLFLGCFLLMIGWLMTGGLAAAPTNPVLAIPVPLFEVGSVTNRYISHVFILCNQGESPLVITRVRACCGASYHLSTTNLPPATSAEIRVRLDLAGRTGPFRKTVYLHTNDPAHPITALRLIGFATGYPASESEDLDDTDRERALQTTP